MNRTVDKKGSFRHERFPRELSPDYFKLDDRSIDDIVVQTAKLAKHVRYFNEQNQEEGTWEDFFRLIYDYENNQIIKQHIDAWEKNGQMPPHLALYFAFIKVFNIGQDELNRITQRHLEYFYTNILKFERKKEVPDRAHLFLEINKKEQKALITQGTLFDGGNDKAGKKRFYASDFDLIVNKVEVSQIKTFTSIITQNNGTPIINFSTQNNLLTDKESHIAEVGFAISSPTFYLKDGERKITFSLDKQIMLDSLFTAHYSTPTGWQEVEFSRTDNTIILSKALPPMVGYNESIHQMQLAAKDPVIRFSLKKDVNKDNLSGLKELKIKKISVNVEGSQDILLYNDLGKINIEIPFMPFGPNPVPGASKFIVGNNKIFNKFLDWFNFNIEWKGCPIDLEKHYASYSDGIGLLSNYQKTLYKPFVDQIQSMKAKLPDTKFLGYLYLLINGEWKEWKERNEWKEWTKDENNSRYEVNLKDNTRDDIREIVTEYTNEAKSGFVKFISALDYGHAIYSTLLGKVMMHNSTKNPVKIEPEKPYTPEINSLYISYSTVNENDFQLFSIHPFRNIEVDNNSSLTISLSDEKNEKCFYLALDKVLSACEVNIFLEIYNPVPYHDGDNHSWSYFDSSNSNWKKLEDHNIVRNTTDNFKKSGVITLIISEETIPADSDKVWLRLSIVRKIEQFPEILSARNNCVSATFIDTENELSHLKLGLPGGSITKFKEQNPKIKSVEQLQPSFGGKETENNTDFYARISERLRHKNRASSCWDYERLTLENFQEIAFASCLAHSELEEKNNQLSFVPGKVLVLVTPNTSLLRQDNPLTPTVPAQLLDEIENFLKNQASPHVEKIQVKNFTYKPITVACTVQLRKGYSDSSFYKDKLNSDLKNFISPWISDTDDSYKNSIMYKSKNVADIYFFLENLEYIDFVIKAEAYFPENKKHYTISDKSIEKQSHEVFTSAENHDITIVSNG